VQIRAAYRYAGGKGWLDGADPFMDFELPRAPEPDPQPLTSAELCTCRAACRNWRHITLWGLLVYTGMRRNEIRLLSWEDIDMIANTITVRSENAKFGKRRIVPMHPGLHDILEAAPDSRVLTPSAAAAKNGRVKQGALLWTSAAGSASKKPGGHYAAGQSFEKLKRPLAPDFGFHRFRRTVATSLADNGVPGDIIDKIMGWAPATIRARYYVKTKEDALHQAILKLYADDPLDLQSIA
jgi:integrase